MQDEDRDALSLNDGRQVLVCLTQQVAARLNALYSHGIIVQVDPDETLTVLSDRSVILFAGALPALFDVALDAVFIVREPIPDDLTKADAIKWAAKHKVAYTIESSAQAAATVAPAERTHLPLPVEPVADDPIKSKPRKRKGPPTPDEILTVKDDATFARIFGGMSEDQRAELGAEGADRYRRLKRIAQDVVDGGGIVLPDAEQDDPDVLPGDGPDEDIPEDHPAGWHAQEGPIQDSMEPINGTDRVEPSRIWVKGEPDGWSRPYNILQEQKPPDEMDASVLPPWLFDHVSDCSARVGGDVGMCTLTALTALSSLIDDRYSVQVKQFDTGWHEEARLWSLILGDASTGKNPSMESAGASLLQKIDQEARKAGVKRLKDHAMLVDEFLVRRKKYISEKAENKVTVPPDEPEPCMADWFMCSDYTEAGLARALENQAKRKILLYTDEPSFLAFDRFNNGKGSGRQEFLQLYQGRPKTSLRRGDGVMAGGTNVPAWSACVLAASTPSGLRSMIGPVQTLEDGLLQRCLINIARVAVRGEDRVPDPHAQAAFERACRNLFAMKPFDGGALRFTPEASELFNAFDDYIQRQTESSVITPPHKAHIFKWRGMAPRLALTLFAACTAERGTEINTGESIPSTHMETAIKLLTDWQGPHIAYLWNAVLGSGRELDNDLRTVAEIICAYHLESGKITLRDITNSYKRWAKLEPRAQKQCLDALTDYGWIEVDPLAKTRVGGIATAYKVNPALYDMFDQDPLIIGARRRRSNQAREFQGMRGQ